MKPICVPCQRFYRPKQNGFYFVEGMPKTDKAIPGNFAPHMWKPYKLWVGDLWECKGCGHSIVVGVQALPLAEHYEKNFAQSVAKFGATYQVNDC